MKKTFLTIAVCLLFLPGVARAQMLPIETSITPTASPKPTPTIVDYSLPYPGLLPGNPLYNLKMVRDKIVEVLITDPLKKSNYYLLQADKRLAAGIMLFERNEEEAGEETISKSLNYLEKSLEKAKQAKTEGKNIADIVGKIKSSSAKQQEQINSLIAKNSADLGQRLKLDLRRAVNLQKSAEQIKP